MNELQIRRMFITDDCWERTSLSWKALKPKRNFNHFCESDESKSECYERLKFEFNIPIEVVEQWIYQHYYNVDSVNNYGWIDYKVSTFKKQKMNIKQLKSLKIIKNYEPYVRSRESSAPFEEFMCKPEDKTHWIEHQTWRVPPIVIDVNSFDNIPDYSEVSGAFQLVEGHSRLGYLLAMNRSGILKKRSHDVYLLTGPKGNV